MEDFQTISENTDDISPAADYDDILFRDDFDISVEDDCDVHKELVHFIDKKRSVNSIDTKTLENARKFIFAEKLVSCIALECHDLVYSTKLNKDLDSFFDPFCETIKRAACIIRTKINNTNTSSFEIIGDLIKWHKLCYEVFVDAVLGHYSQKDLTAGQFFCFCVYVSELAAKCCTTDFEEVLDFAVYAILDAFCVYKGRINELIDFAKAVAYKSDESFNQMDIVKIFALNLEESIATDKSNKCEVINNFLKLSIKENVNNQENEIQECGAALEQLKLVDKYDKYGVRGNFEIPINEIVEELIRSVEHHVNNCNLSFCDENCCSSLFNKVSDRECKKVSCPTENKFFEDILQEVLSVVNFEASLFSEIYALPKNQLNLESEDDSHSTDTEVKIECSTCSSFQDIQVRDSCLFKELAPHDCIGKKVETSVNASVIPNSAIRELEKEVESASPDDTLEHTDVKFPDGESKILELKKSKFILENVEDNKVKSSTEGSAMNFAQTEFEINSDMVGIVDNNSTKEVKHNFIEKETKIFKEIAIISNPEFKLEENEKPLEDFSGTLKYENLNFRNIELKELDTVICENSSENNDNKVEDNFKQSECESNENFVSSFDDNIILPVGTEDGQIVDFFAIYKSEGEINEENIKVLKGDTILFAEDLVRYIMIEFYGISYSESILDEIRCLSSNSALNETVKQVLNSFHKKCEILNRVTFDIIANVKENNIDYYRKYVAMVLSHYVEDGLNSDVFLYFCLHFSELAAKFYALDRPEITDFAICSILDAFCLLKDDWCEFKVATEKVLYSFKTNFEDQCSGCKIHYYVDNFERECVNAILDVLKTFLHEEIAQVCSINSMPVEKVNRALLSKTLKNSEADVNSQLYETETIIDEKTRKS